MVSIIHVIERDFKIKLKSPSTLTIPVLTPLVYLLLYGVAMNQTVSQFSYLGSTITYYEFLFPGIIVMSSVSLSLTSGITIFSERHEGMFEELLMCPIRRVYIIMGKVLLNVVLSLVQALNIIILSSVIMNRDFLTVGGLLLSLAAVFLASVGFGGLSMIIAWNLNTVQSFGVIIRLLDLPLIFASTAFYPIESVPQMLQPIAQWNPITCAADIVRNAVLGHVEPQSMLVKVTLLFAFAASMSVIASYFFRRAIKK